MARVSMRGVAGHDFNEPEAENDITRRLEHPGGDKEFRKYLDGSEEMDDEVIGNRLDFLSQEMAHAHTRVHKYVRAIQDVIEQKIT